MQVVSPFPEGNGSLPLALYRLLDPNAPADLPPAGSVKLSPSDNRELDKLVAALGRNKTTWRRALLLHEWLLAIGYQPDDRLCTSLIRVCAQHGQFATALAIYDWMTAYPEEGGAGMRATVFTYTAAMRAALSGNMVDRALAVWADAEADVHCEADCRLATTFIEVAAKNGDTDGALGMYNRMKIVPKDSRLAPTVHAFTAAMRAASEGGRWETALTIWDDMQGAGCNATGHAYAAVISACAAGGQWERAVQLFDEMLALGVKPDVVSCTALITALSADGQWQRAEKVVEWMARSDIKPNVRTYTALIAALGSAKQWERAIHVLQQMRSKAYGSGIEPNAWTYSALIKSLGEHGKLEEAEKIFLELEQEQLALMNGEKPSSVLDDSSSSQMSAFPGMSKTVPLELRYDAYSGLSPTVRQESEEERKAVHGVVTSAAEAVLGELDVLSTAQIEASHKELESLGDSSPVPLSPFPSHGGFSYFSSSATSTQPPLSLGVEDVASEDWTGINAAVQGLQVDLMMSSVQPSSSSSPKKVSKQAPRGKGPLNEVVCGALMLAYERAGKWQEAVGVLDRSRAVGIVPNTIMINTALSALGKAGQADAAQLLFDSHLSPDVVTYETLIAAHGMIGDAGAAESTFSAMVTAGHLPRDYAYCGLIAAYGFRCDWRAANKVLDRMKATGIKPTVHIYNALVAACDHAGQYEKAIKLVDEMKAMNIEPNSVTKVLMDSVCKEGVRAVESQQALAAALSAAVGAAGAVMIRAGIF